MRNVWRFMATFLVATMVATVGLIGCSSSTGTVAPTATPAKSTTSPTTGASSTAPTAAKSGTTQFAGTVNVAALGPLTGQLAATGLDLVMGVELAASQINDAGGVKIGDKAYKINVIRYDDQYKPEVAANLARRIRAVDNAPFLVGVGMSSSILAIMEINEKEEILLVCEGTTPAITEKGNKLVVRTNNPTSVDASRIADVAINKSGLKNWVIIADGQDWGKSMADMWGQSVAKFGGKVLGTEIVDQGTQKDFYPQLTKLLALKPDAIALAIHDQASSLAIKQSRELGWTGPFIENTGYSSEGIRLTGWDKLGVGSLIFVNPADLNVAPAIKYLADYKAKFNQEGLKGQGGMLTYSQMKLVARAMEKAGTVTDVNKVRAAIPEVYKEVSKETPFEFTSYSENGQMNIGSPIAKHTGDGKLELVAK